LPTEKIEIALHGRFSDSFSVASCPTEHAALRNALMIYEFIWIPKLLLHGNGVGHLALERGSTRGRIPTVLGNPK
jgi:hypothetical protein